jgi:hypothetical protein
MCRFSDAPITLFQETNFCDVCLHQKMWAFKKMLLCYVLKANLYDLSEM